MTYIDRLALVGFIVVALLVNVSWSFTKNFKIGRARLASAIHSTREVARGFPADVDTSVEGSVIAENRKSYGSSRMANPTGIDMETLDVSSEGDGVEKKITTTSINSDIHSGERLVKRSGSIPVMALEGDSSEEQPYQRAVVAAHFSIVLTNVVVAMSAILSDSGGLSPAELFFTKVYQYLQLL